MSTLSRRSADLYLRALVLSRDKPGIVEDSLLAELRETACAYLGGAEAEYVQNSFELVADVMRSNRSYEAVLETLVPTK